MNRGLNHKNTDPQTNLHIIEHALAESMYIKDINAVI
jgi:hypothetical protein